MRRARLPAAPAPDTAPRALKTVGGSRPFDRDDLIVNRWGARFAGHRVPCAVGRGGIRKDKAEGDLASPVGVWQLRWLYVRADRMRPPLGVLPVRALGPGQGWSETPGAPDYNSPVRHTHTVAADRMARGDGLYDLCAVTDHNTGPAIPGLGSAIFVHCWRKPRHPTAGCIAFRKPDLIWILTRWTPRSRLVIRH